LRGGMRFLSVKKGAKQSYPRHLLGPTNCNGGFPLI